MMPTADPARTSISASSSAVMVRGALEQHRLRQRIAPRQPALRGSAVQPARSCRAARSPERRRRVAEKALGDGGGGRGEKSRTGADSTTLPSSSTMPCVAMRESTARSCVMKIERHAVVLDERQEQIEDLRLDRDVERRRRLVGDEQARAARESRRDRDALTLPAGQLVRIPRHDALGVGKRDARGLPHGPRTRLGAARRARGSAPTRRSAGRRCGWGSGRCAAPGRRSRCRRRAAAASSRSGSPSSSRPFHRIEPPAVAPSGSSPRMASAVRDLPDPDSPMSPTRAPSGTSNDTPSTTRRSPMSIVRSRTSSVMPPPPARASAPCGPSRRDA